MKWPEVATRIADLIDDDNYLTEQEKAGYVEYRAEQNRQKELRAEEERQKREIIELAIVSEQPGRKQRILDEYSKTTKIEDFAKFLRDEYGTAVETTGCGNYEQVPRKVRRKRRIYQQIQCYRQYRTSGFSIVE